MDNQSRFKSVVFAGGGSRCFWQLGFWTAAAQAIDIRPEVVAGVSAGAAFACFSLAADAERVLNYFKKLTSANRKNFFGKTPAFPHYAMYIDNVPVFMVEERIGEKLVLLTRRYRTNKLAGHENVTFVQPSEEIKITKWEYTDPVGLQMVGNA